MKRVDESRLILDLPAPGAWNMAVDEVLLQDAAENGTVTLRLYQWVVPTLSLGYFQKYDDRRQHAASRHCACVRRQTGGGAILHDRELTYSITLPASHPLARQTELLYSSIHDAFIEAIETVLGDQLTGWALRRRDQESSKSARDEPFLCFERRARGDVVLEFRRDAGDPHSSQSSRDGKILGSAQRRHRGAILQHGSLLLGTSPAAPELSGLGERAGKQILPDELSQAAVRQIAAVLRVPTSPSALPPDMELKAQELTNTKYGASTWTKRR
jgi:lipoate-protein ligase A